MRKQTRYAIMARAAVKTPSGTTFRCAYCGTELPHHLVQLDHVTAKANGGRDAAANRVVSCSACNESKKDRSLESFARKLVARDAWLAAAKAAPPGSSREDVGSAADLLTRTLARAIVRRVRAEAARKPVAWLGRVWAVSYYAARRAA